MLTYSYFSDRGDREVNEDAVGVSSDCEKGCYVLCDGLGGHGYGDIASRVVIENALSFYSKNSNLTDDKLSELFDFAQLSLVAEQKKSGAYKHMKTTAVILFVSGEKVLCGHSGDSRLYAFANGEIVFRTLDHSVPQMLALSGRIDESEIRFHPDRSTLLRALGTDAEKKQYEVRDITECAADAFLLCSDGFWELIDEINICSCLECASSAEEWLSLMRNVVENANLEKTADNRSAIAILRR